MQQVESFSTKSIKCFSLLLFPVYLASKYKPIFQKLLVYFFFKNSDIIVQFVTCAYNIYIYTHIFMFYITL